MSSVANREALVITYFRDITTTSGVRIAVLVSRDNCNEVRVCVREDWEPVLLYDKDADLEYLQSFILEHLQKFTHDTSGLNALIGAENSIRAEKLEGTDPDFDQKLADAIRGLTSPDLSGYSR